MTSEPEWKVGDPAWAAGRLVHITKLYRKYRQPMALVHEAQRTGREGYLPREIPVKLLRRSP